MFCFFSFSFIQSKSKTILHNQKFEVGGGILESIRCPLPMLQSLWPRSPKGCAQHYGLPEFHLTNTGLPVGVDFVCLCLECDSLRTFGCCCLCHMFYYRASQHKMHTLRFYWPDWHPIPPPSRVNQHVLSALGRATLSNMRVKPWRITQLILIHLGLGKV